MMLSDLRIFSFLVQREMRGMRQRFTNMLINGIAVGVTETLVYGFFMPKFGMPVSVVPLMYIGTIMMFLINIGTTRLFKDSFDITSTRFIDYQLTLPISRFWLFASFFTAYIIELTVQAFFPFVLGMLLINPALFFAQISFGALLVAHLLSISFCALLFLTMCYAVDYQWLIDHLWPRVLGPMFCLGAVWYPWSLVNTFFPRLSIVFLCNPFTYMVEAFRGAILNSPHVVSFELSVAVIGSLSLLLIGALTYSVKSRLDLV